MNNDELINKLDTYWGDDGLLDLIRRGDYRVESAKEFLTFLKSVEIPDDSAIPKRLISLLWYLPLFLEWQKVRISEKGGDMKAYEIFVTEVQNTLEEILGVP